MTSDKSTCAHSLRYHFAKILHSQDTTCNLWIRWGMPMHRERSGRRHAQPGTTVTPGGEDWGLGRGGNQQKGLWADLTG